MAVRLRVISAGMVATIQDAGRRGHLRHGVSTSGPMDWVSFELAQRLAGVAWSTAAMEVGIGGIELEVIDGDARLGVAGAGFDVAIDGVPVQHPASIRLRPSMRLTVKAGRSGAWIYIVPAPAMVLEPVLGSRATHARYGIGPAGGKPLQAGCEIGLENEETEFVEFPLACPAPKRDAPIRVILGPQDHLFAVEEIQRFLASSYRLTARNDRMAYVLAGPVIQPDSKYDLVTEATALGSIQIAGDGSPYVLMADRSSTGGYPKIATIIRADIGLFAQKRAGDEVRFEETDVATAVAILRDLRGRLERAGVGATASGIDLEALSRGDTHAGVWDAFHFDG